MSSYQDVLAAVREYIQDPEIRWFGIWEPRWALAEKIPGSTWRRVEPEDRGDRRGTLTSTYCTRVYRAVGVLVSEGALVKEGEGRDAVYWTPAALAEHRARRAREEAAEAVLKGRWSQVRARLAARGYGGISTGGSLEEWERLLDELERSG